MPSSMKRTIKLMLNTVGQFIVLPFVIMTWLERLISSRCEVVFNTCGQLMALLPGLPGAFLRRAFYTLTLERCSAECHIGFGVLISHRGVVIEEHAYVGNYALLGSCHLGAHCLIGSRASIVSGKSLHEKNLDGTWTAFSHDKIERVKVGRHVWIGEGAIIIADVGDGSCVGSGSVVTTNVKSNVMVSGNPARFVKSFEVSQVVNEEISS